MESPVKILILEDEMIIGANISLQLSRLGCEVTGIISRGEEAINHVGQQVPGVGLMVIRLGGVVVGLGTGQQIQKEYKVPVV